MDCIVRFEGDESNIAKATQAMLDFNSVLPIPKEIGIYKMVPISEDYFYYLLSEKGIVSKEQGRNSLERFNKETKGMNEDIVFCYKEFARNMLSNYESHGACTTESWKQKYWGTSEQPVVKAIGNGGILLSNALSVPIGIIDAVCNKCTVTAEINR